MMPGRRGRAGHGPRRVGMREEADAGRAPAPPPPAGRRRSRPEHPAAAAATADGRSAGGDAAGRPTRSARVARRHQPRLAAAAGLLRARQLRDQAGGPGDPAGLGGGAEAAADMADHRRGPLRRARHRRVQPVARRAALDCRQDLSGDARHRRRSPAHGELRQGVPVRSRPRRSGVEQEPPRAFRGHRQSSRLPGDPYADQEADDQTWQRAAAAGVAMLLMAAPAHAQRRELQQLAADLRILQEQTQLLQNQLIDPDRGAEGGQRPHRRAGRR